MRRICVIEAAIAASLAISNAQAGGFDFDPARCPTGHYFPGPSIPQEATDVLCGFLLAVDQGRPTEAYRLVSPEYRSSETLDQFIKTSTDIRQRGGASGDRAPTRSLLNVRQERDILGSIYRFTLQVYYAKSMFTEDIYVRATPGGAEIAGLRLGPG